MWEDEAHEALGWSRRGSPGEKEKGERVHKFTQHLAQKKQPGPIESSGVGGKAVVVSLNEAARIDHMAGKRGRKLLRSFGVLLLAYNKVPLLEESLEESRFKL